MVDEFVAHTVSSYQNSAVSISYANIIGFIEGNLNAIKMSSFDFGMRSADFGMKMGN